MGPASRYRIYQFKEYFEAEGIQLDILPALGDNWLMAEYSEGFKRQLTRSLAGCNGLLRRLKHLGQIGKADLVILEREVFPKLPGPLERLFLKQCPRYGVELDDAIYLSAGREKKYPKLLQKASFAITGNNHLADWVRKHQSQVYTVPTCVRTEDYAPKTNYTLKSQPEVGWVGLSSNLPYLSSVAPHLHAALQANDAKLHVLSGRPGNLELPIIFSAWAPETEKRIIESFDIGIMPLPDSEFAKGKCGLKILQYMAAGIPVIASAVGVNRSIIEDGVNGLLVEQPSQWTTAINRLLNDEKLRESMGRAGRRTVEASYSTQIWGPKLVALYRELASSP